MIDTCTQYEDYNNNCKSEEYLSFHRQSGASYLPVCTYNIENRSATPVRRIFLKDEYIRSVLNKRAVIRINPGRYSDYFVMSSTGL
ncbi:hypothetical protein KDAU_56140 [Dictyobacter aurantiacus]|uniref:Uncharacterized protein n=1 Tax=Dictyobacter aurantiacus TaxID=1936993 RepID=A0A401ZN47_9CHLR|nr:hypothetical protein KDAU_56140 [Dictyobacter aurantiacus]